MVKAGLSPDGGDMSATMTLDIPQETSHSTVHDPERPGRDPSVDLLRAMALLIVVLGHWLLAVVHWHDGKLQAHNLLDVAPPTQWATWLFQPMPLFFAVGGWAAARSWSTRRSGTTRSDWVAARIQRLLIPAGTYVVVATLIAAGVIAVVGDTADPVAALLGTHLWFLAVYLPVTAATPWLCELTTKLGWRLPLALGTAVVIVDVARFVVGVPGIGWANFAFLWLGFSALGVAAADRPPRVDRLIPCAIAALTALAIVVAVGWYPHSMVGVGDQSNNTPPTLALGLLGLAQVALAAAAAPWLRRWLDRRAGARRKVDVLGAISMHAYLWHLCAVVVVVWVMRSGVGNLEPLDVTWWATRPLWWLVLALIAAPVVAIALRVDRRRIRNAPPAIGASAARVLVATAVATVAFTVLALGGIGSGWVALGCVLGVLGAQRLAVRGWPSPVAPQRAP